MSFFPRLIVALRKPVVMAVKKPTPLTYIGAGRLRQAAELLRQTGSHRVLVMTTPGMMRRGQLDQTLSELKENGMEAVVFDRVSPDPTFGVVEEAVSCAAGCDAILAVGGGSVLDAAKTAAAAIANHKPAEKLVGTLKVKKQPMPLIAVPTTAGTGSETTLAAVVTDTKTHEKYALNDPVLRPKYAVLDPELTVGLPPHITSTTGMDALTHAVEAYIGHSNTKETSAKAEEATKLIFENLEEAYKNGKDIHAREQMLLASHYAGIAFTRAYVGNVHAIAHNLGGFYGVPHGLANAIILPYVLDFYGDTAYERLARLCECAGVAKAGQSDEQKALDFIQAIRDMNARMNIPDKIDKIQEKDIETIAKRACKEANPLYPVPRIMDLDDCIAIIHRLMP